MSDHTKDRLTVLHIFSGDLWAGAEVVIFNLVNKLKDDPSLKIIALSLNEGVLTEKLQEGKVETYVIPEALHSFPRIFLKAFNLLFRKRINIIHSHRYKENLLALFLAQSMGLKQLVATLHGLPESPLHGRNGEKLIRLKTKMDYFILKYYFTHVVAVSQVMKRTLIQKYGFDQGKVDVIHNGTPLPLLSPSRDHSTHDYFHIGTVGRMVPVKDFNLFLEVVTQIKRQNKKVRFSILGDGPLKEQLIQKAKDLKIEDSVEFLSPRPNPSPYYQSLDLYLNVSLHEGIPLSILEAMACGKPVVAPKVGGIPEIISDGEQGLLVEGREPEKFVLPCLRLIQNEDLRIMMGENASKRVVSCFSDFKMVESYNQLYQQICKRS